ncbi:MAG: cysteine desulfurase DndA [Nibricoccus sp.]
MKLKACLLFCVQEKTYFKPNFRKMTGPIYLDCNATTPLEPAVQACLFHHLTEEYGNSGSRTHEFGNRAKVAVQKARDQVAAVVNAKREEVVFTSGATESNNLAILGLREYGEKTGRKHIICTAIEHKAVLEPIEQLAAHGFSVSIVKPDRDGVVHSDAVSAVLRKDTLLVSVMHVNNETGVVQPIDEIASTLVGHETYFHVDAAQGFGKTLPALSNTRLDFISVSAHKIYGPKGVGALIIRRRGFERTPLCPLLFGGGQERGLRPGTLPVALVVALGEAAQLATRDHAKRGARCTEIKNAALKAFLHIGGEPVGNQTRTLPSTLNIRFPGLDSEALMVALKDSLAISNGSACTSSSYTPSHVLKAMGFDDKSANQCVRLSWCHLTPDVDWDHIAERIQALRD